MKGDSNFLRLQSPSRKLFEFLLMLWVGIHAWCSLAGWGLSMSGTLSTTGYWIVTLVSLVAAALLWWKKSPVSLVALSLSLGKTKRRFARLDGFFLLFLSVAVVSILGAMFHAPSQADALEYRLPRLLRWLANDSWYWIDFHDVRFNSLGPGQEWMFTWLIALTGSDRLLAIPNLTGFFLFPSLLFLCMAGCGVSRPVASRWMWIVSLGSIYAMQAGGIGNDFPAVVLALSSVWFAMRAVALRSFSALFFSILSAGLMTSFKLGNLPLCLVPTLLLFPLLKEWKWLLPRVGIASPIWLAVSVVPTLLLNLSKTGHYAGDPNDSKLLQIHEPVAGFLANVVLLITKNLQPPVHPLSSFTNRLVTGFESTSFYQFLKTGFPRLELSFAEMTTEEGGGIGLGVFLLLLVALILQISFRVLSREKACNQRPGAWLAISLGGLVALGVYMFKVGSEANPRLIAAYYPFVIICVLMLPIHRYLLRKKWWKIFTFLLLSPIVVSAAIAPSRPIIPFAKILPQNQSEGMNPALKRVSKVYQIYSQRSDNFYQLRKEFLQDSDFRVGLVKVNPCYETSLWKPFGSREVIFISMEGEITELESEGIDVLLIDDDAFEGIPEKERSTWISERGFYEVGYASVPVRVSSPPVRFLICRCK